MALLEKRSNNRKLSIISRFLQGSRIHKKNLDTITNIGIIFHNRKYIPNLSIYSYRINRNVCPDILVEHERLPVRHVAVVNQKGGVGKTTTAVCLAGALRERGWHILLIDLDPQASASSWLGGASTGRDLLDTLLDSSDVLSLVSPTPSCIDLIPCGVQFAGFDRVTAGEPGAEYLLRDVMQRLPSARWDVIFYDCPPNLNIASVSALVAAEMMLVPVAVQYLSLEPLARLFHIADRVRERLNPALLLSGIVGCLVDFRTNHSRDVLAKLHERFGDMVYRAVIRDNIRVAEAPGFQQPITHYAPHSHGARDYRQLAAEFANRVDLPPVCRRGSTTHEPEKHSST